jgi:coenzyme F420-reducing hydrogenase delta subunit
MNKPFKPKITLFHCINSFNESASLSLNGANNVEIKTVRLPCSSMVKDVFLLRSFESGADGVLVLVCPEDQCRYVEGSIRAKKRVGWVQIHQKYLVRKWSNNRQDPPRNSGSTD